MLNMIGVGGSTVAVYTGTGAQNMAKQKLGPMQRAWIRSLESGDNLQGTGALARRTSKRAAWRLCCLGVACEVVVANDMPMDVVVYEYGNGEQADYDTATGHLPCGVTELFGFHGQSGTLKFAADAEKAAAEGMHYLTDLNDTARWTFKKIAAFARKYPHVVFKEPR